MRCVSVLSRARGYVRTYAWQEVGSDADGRRRRKGPSRTYDVHTYVRTWYRVRIRMRTYVRIYVRTYVYVQNALRTFVIRTYSRGSRSAMREEPVNQGHALPVNATVRAFRRVKPGSVSGMLLNNSYPSRGAEAAAAARPCTSGGRRGLQLPS